MRKHFWKLKPRNLIEIYCPILLSCSVVHQASTNCEVHLSSHFEDRRAELKCEGQSFATLFRVVYGKICWNCHVRVITPLELDRSNSLGWHFHMKPPHPFFSDSNFYLKEANTHQERKNCQYLSPPIQKPEAFLMGWCSSQQKLSKEVRHFRNLSLRDNKLRTCFHMQWNFPS